MNFHERSEHQRSAVEKVVESFMIMNAKHFTAALNDGKKLPCEINKKFSVFR